MKIPIKYGLLTALGIIVWVLVAHSLIANQQSLVFKLGEPIFFNVLHFIMIFLGLKAYEREKGERPVFKEAVKVGVSIALVYAFAATLFFIGLVLVVGARWMGAEPGASLGPKWMLALAFAGMFVGTIVLGLIYSTVIAFFVSRRLSDEART